MINPAIRASRRAEILLVSLSNPKYNDKRVRRYTLLADSITSKEFGNYIKALGNSVAIIPPGKIEENEKRYLLEVPTRVLSNASEIAMSQFGSEEFRQGLAGLIATLQAALRAEERINEIHASL